MIRHLDCATVERMLRKPVEIDGVGNPCQDVIWGTMSFSLESGLGAGDMVAFVGLGMAADMEMEGRLRSITEDADAGRLPGRVFGLLGSTPVSMCEGIPPDHYVVASRRSLDGACDCLAVRIRR